MVWLCCDLWTSHQHINERLHLLLTLMLSMFICYFFFLFHSLYAFLGTLISTLLIGSSIFGFLSAYPGSVGPTPNKKLVWECMMFGSLLSAVDPVGSLAVLANVFNIDPMGRKQNPLLYNLIFGESVLNDAIALVLFHTFQRFYTQQDEFSEASPFTALGTVAYIFIGSLAVGSLCAVVTALITKYDLVSRFYVFAFAHAVTSLSTRILS